MAVASFLPRIKQPDPAVLTQQTDRIVVALHGTLGHPYAFEPLRKALPSVVVPLAYGDRGTATIEASSREVADFLARVPRRVSTIDLVGHSYGGLIALLAAHDPRLSGRIGTIVGLGASWRGVPVEGNRFTRWATRHVLGESFVDLMTDEPADPVIPDLVRVVSVISSSDSQVPESSSRLGTVVCVGPVPHNQLTQRTDVVRWALGME